MLAGLAAQPNIGAEAHDAPGIAPARMHLAELHHIVERKRKYHTNECSVLSPRDGASSVSES